MPDRYEPALGHRVHRLGGHPVERRAAVGPADRDRDCRRLTRAAGRYGGWRGGFPREARRSPSVAASAGTWRRLCAARVGTGGGAAPGASGRSGTVPAPGTGGGTAATEVHPAWPAAASARQRRRRRQHGRNHRGLVDVGDKEARRGCTSVPTL